MNTDFIDRYVRQRSYGLSSRESVNLAFMVFLQFTVWGCFLVAVAAAIKTATI